MTPQSMRTKWWEWLVLAAAIVGGARFALKRLNEGLGLGFHVDFDTYFLPAAAAILSGSSPYTVAGYVHPPFTALVIAALDRSASNHVAAWLVLQTLAGFAGVILSVWTLTIGSALWLRAGVLGAAFISLFATRPTTRIFYLGQSDLLLLLGVSLALFLIVTKRPLGAGLALTLPAMVKLWPALFLVWVFTRRLPGRRGVLLGVTAGGLATIASTLALRRVPWLERPAGLSGSHGQSGHHLILGLGSR